MTQKLTNGQAECIAQHGQPVAGLLDRVEQALRDTKQTGLAEQFLRLVCDINLEQEPTFEPDPRYRPQPPGPMTEALWNAYKPVTTTRVANVFTAVLNCPTLETGLRQEFAAFLTELALPTHQSAPSIAGAPRP